MDGDTIEIIGLGDTPLTVDADLNVSQGGPAAEQDIMADMKAAVAADLPPESKEAPKEPAAEEKPAEDSKADAGAKAEGEKPAEEKPADKLEPAAEDKPADDKAPEVKAEEKPAEEKTEEAKEDEKPAEAKDETEGKEAAEPTETEKLVEELGGVEVLKAAQPFVESIYDPDLPVSERVSRLEAFVPEAQMKAMRNEVFWQAAETDEIQDMLAADPKVHEVLSAKPELREAFAQEVFGVPFGYIEKLFNDDKTFLSDEEFKEAVAEFQKETPAAKAPETKKETPAKEEPKAREERKDTKAKEEPKAEATELTPAFTGILNDLSKDVDQVFTTAKLDADEKDDADTKRLKAEASTQFETEWSKAFQADEEAMKAYRAVKGLADQGAEPQARQKYSLLSKHAKRVAAQLLERVTEPLTTHRRAAQEKGKAAAAARTESPAAAKEKTFDTPGKPAVDVSGLRSDAEITRAMEEAIERNSQKG